MRKLLSVALLLAGCTLPQARAQSSPASPSTVAATASAPTPPLHWAAAEFCEAYAHYYPALPSLYRYNAGQALQHTPLAAPNANVAALLLQQQALREAVYQTLYQYCHTLKYGLDNSSEIEELLHQFLYDDFHMSELAASYLAPQIAHRYRQPAPTALAKQATTPTTRSTPVREMPSAGYTSDPRRSVPARALYGEPGSARRPPEHRDGLEVGAWRFDSPPIVEVVDDSPGVVRFRLEVADDGEVESVTKVSGNVSPAQEKLCQEALLKAHLVKITAEAEGATGYYTFRISAR